MFDYEQDAKDFLTRCGAKMTFERVGLFAPTWSTGGFNSRSVLTFNVTISTPRGIMTVVFYDSVFCTERYKEDKSYHPSEYDVLSALQKYDVGTIDDFVQEYGYEVKKWSDVKKIEKTYKLCKKEYKDLCRIFAENQMEELREIE